ncbi:hypothetical protein EKN06_00515 [Croceicoccus ponticola]|uniref:Uncharacterized protein n=1 Tax=Croceicoccus ponticola TaxID=2217664 RepID=A0A437GZN7_9SPHN|nr:hypothetical protein [Croceicoccus ponticola]RVQ68752.1 hypothetical protein EKN06_00515 [Croceicoccus ponticola]
MTRQKEDELLARRRELRRRAHELIQRIVEARLKGERDAEAIGELARLSQEEVEMTSPDLTLAA